MHNNDGACNGYAIIGLDNPKFDANVGSVLRAAGCYNVAMVAISGKRFKKTATDTTNQHKRIPILQVSDLHNVVPYDCVPIAVEILPNAKSLVTYIHPKRAFYVFGAEDATLGDRILSWCRDIIYVPTAYCMNLAATVNVVLYDRMAKEKVLYHSSLALNTS